MMKLKIIAKNSNNSIMSRWLDYNYSYYSAKKSQVSKVQNLKNLKNNVEKLTSFVTVNFQHTLYAEAKMSSLP